MKRWLDPPLGALIAIFVLGNTGGAICAALGREVPAAFMILYYIGIAWAFSWWVLSDCHARNVATSIDHGWFVFYAWPLMVPYHVLKTRGIRGCGLLLLMFGAFLAAYAFALGVFVVISAVR